MLTLEDIRKAKEKYDKEDEDLKKRLQDIRKKELDEMGIKMTDENKIKPKPFHGDCDHPNTIENGTATFFYIIIMLVGAIFKGNWVIWIIATVIWAKFITRHNKK